MNGGIVLSIPLVKENTLPARLLTAGICSNLGFDVEATEDLKLAVSEALVVMLKQGFQSAEIVFDCVSGLEPKGVSGAGAPPVTALSVGITAGGDALNALDENDVIGLQLLAGLVNDVKFERTNGIISQIRLFQNVL